MGKAEEKYRYLLNKDKYDSKVNAAVSSKSLSEKDANTISKIQEMMREEREKKGIRNIVTSENREEFMQKKLAEKAGKKPKEVKKDEQLERVKKHPKYADMVVALGKKGAMDALLKELNDKQ